ncbi:MAG: hypothetical protein AVDCRST_MAG89-1320 [uncultured Gemmatimonadetes bacterium]|uniref:Uncharacterized protein n=1 Tax=uncultured Gemmatimonadota bacterium TaxID=203437 RepID=A0A6J4KTX3_9BACT|nr:MAG: hypothetical protein AVDCRST_MAG89-1320 [uncultured Gemmatimonadota bacterium]
MTLQIWRRKNPVDFKHAAAAAGVPPSRRWRRTPGFREPPGSSRSAAPGPTS